MIGLLLVLALLMASWLLRACAPVDPSTSLTTLETPAPPAPPPPPDPTLLLKAALDQIETDEKKLTAELAALQADIRSKVAACKLVEVPKPPPPPPVAKAAPAPLPADRWAQKDLGMLQGCWRLGRDTQGNIGTRGRSEACAVKAGRICFQANGVGERQTTAVCPGTGTLSCSAPITARFGNDSTLGTTQPVVSCSQPGTSWNGAPNSLTCRRVSDSLALCRDRLGFEHEFRRE
ncbi:hypothetical protein BH11PSE3_BH11PSE3_43470 [soil metagenome]